MISSLNLSGLLSALFAVTLLAAPGDLDPTFGTAGKVTTTAATLGNSFKIGSEAGMAWQGDGKMVVAATGVSNTNSRIVIAVLRYTANGVLDKTFGTKGAAVLSGTDDYVADGMALQADGKVVVAGSLLPQFGGLQPLAVARFTNTGQPDLDFGTGGLVTASLPLAGLHAHAYAVTVQSDGKIVATGTGDDSVHSFLAVVRFTSTGALDSTFGSGGKVVTNAGNLIQGRPSDDVGNSVVVQSDGKIVVAGRSNGALLLARYTSAGVLDTTFHSNGLVSGGTAAINAANSVTLQPDGKIVVAGIAANDQANDFDFQVARYLSNGDPDTTFHSTGFVTTDFGANNDQAYHVAVQPDGRIVVAGVSNAGGNDDFALARYNADGTLDDTFHATGTVTTRIGNAADNLHGLALQGDGKILAAGYTATNLAGTEFGISVARYIGGNVLDSPVLDTMSVRGDGAAFLDFGEPAVDSGNVGGTSAVRTLDGKKHVAIYGDDSGASLAQTGGPDETGATFLDLGDPLFAGAGLGFAGTAQQPAMATPPFVRFDFADALRAFTVKPGGKLTALYSQMSHGGVIKRLAAQTGAAPGGGQFAKFGAFGLPRTRGGLVFTGSLHRDATVNKTNDFGVWREKTSGGDSDLILRTGKPVAGRIPKKLLLMTPVTNATDQRRSVAPDGAVGAMASFDDGKTGVVTVAADGAESVQADSDANVRDEAGHIIAEARFESFDPPATNNGGMVAFLAALKAAARGIPAPAKQGIFTNQSGTMTRVVARGDALPGNDAVRLGLLGQPCMGQSGMIGFIAALTGQRVTGANRQAIIRMEGGQKSVVARLGEPAPGMGVGVVYRKFISMVVTDTNPGRVVFTATVGGPGINGTNNTGLWCSSAARGTNVVMLKGSLVRIGTDVLSLRTFSTLQAPTKNVGQGRSTDASGFVTAKAKLSDGRTGVLRIPLP
jgi:uncharacterized delta-60 repeat protein